MNVSLEPGLFSMSGATLLALEDSYGPQSSVIDLTSLFVCALLYFKDDDGVMVINVILLFRLN